MISLNNIPLAKFPKTYDVSPGKYALDILYRNVSEVNKTRYIRSGRATAILNAKAGHIYYVYPSIEEKIGKWQLKIVNFEKLEDLSKYSKDFWDTNKDSGESIKERVEQHFKKKKSHSLSVSERKHWE